MNGSCHQNHTVLRPLSTKGWLCCLSQWWLMWNVSDRGVVIQPPTTPRQPGAMFEFTWGKELKPSFRRHAVEYFPWSGIKNSAQRLETQYKILSWHDSLVRTVRDRAFFWSFQIAFLWGSSGLFFWHIFVLWLCFGINALLSAYLKVFDSLFHSLFHRTHTLLRSLPPSKADPWSTLNRPRLATLLYLPGRCGHLPIRKRHAGSHNSSPNGH